MSERIVIADPVVCSETKRRPPCCYQQYCLASTICAGSAGITASQMVMLPWNATTTTIAIGSAGQLLVQCYCSKSAAATTGYCCSSSALLQQWKPSHLLLMITTATTAGYY